MSEPVNSVRTSSLLEEEEEEEEKPLWNQSSPRTNNYLAYSNYSYSGIGPKEHAPSLFLAHPYLSILIIIIMIMINYRDYNL